MLLNHSDTVSFNQEGVYIAYASTLDNPAAWSAPEASTLVASGIRR